MRIVALLNDLESDEDIVKRYITFDGYNLLNKLIKKIGNKITLSSDRYVHRFLYLIDFIKRYLKNIFEPDGGTSIPHIPIPMNVSEDDYAEVEIPSAPTGDPIRDPTLDVSTKPVPVAVPR